MTEHMQGQTQEGHACHCYHSNSVSQHKDQSVGASVCTDAHIQFVYMRRVGTQ